MLEGGEESRVSERARRPGGSGPSARPSLKRQWPGWEQGVGSDGAAGKCRSIPEGIRRRRIITMRWRWTTRRTRGAAPKTRTPRARRSLRMGTAQVRDPAGGDAGSLAPGARQAAVFTPGGASCCERGAGRRGRGGDWLNLQHPGAAGRRGLGLRRWVDWENLGLLVSTRGGLCTLGPALGTSVSALWLLTLEWNVPLASLEDLKMSLCSNQSAPGLSACVGAADRFALVLGGLETH